MKKLITSAGFGAMVALCALAVPSQASTVLSFLSTGTGCTTATSTCGTAVGGGNSSSGNLTALSILDFTKFTEQVNGGTVENWSLSGSPDLLLTSVSGGNYNFSLSGTMSCTTGICAGKNYTGNFFTFTTTSATYSGSAGLGYTISVGSATTLSETATFLNDLGLTTPTGTPTITAGAGTGNSSPFTAMELTPSSTLTVTTNSSYATPEPVTFLLFGTGLAAVAFMTRRRAAAVKA
jgi:hypothetical protein